MGTGTNLIRTQLDIFLVLGLTGIALCLFFDIYRVFRCLTRPHSRWLVGLEDVIFCAGATLLIMVGMIIANWGQLRVYVFLAFGIGWWLCRILLSPLVIPLLFGIGQFMIWLIGRAQLGLWYMTGLVLGKWMNRLLTGSKKLRDNRP